jgi:hypothetical protein
MNALYYEAQRTSQQRYMQHFAGLYKLSAILRIYDDIRKNYA